MKVIWESISVRSDERGLVFEPIGAEALSRQQNVHVVTTLPGFVRGNHAHRRSTEIVVVLGPAHVRYREMGVIEDVRVRDGEAVRFVFPPGVPHAIQNTGDRPNLLVAFVDAPHDAQHPDAVREVLIET